VLQALNNSRANTVQFFVGFVVDAGTLFAPFMKVFNSEWRLLKHVL
jgi:hypothetical protein